MRSLALGIILLIINLILFIGNTDSRQKKANFFGKTIFYPFLYSVAEFKNNKILKKNNAVLQMKVANKTLEIRKLKSDIAKYSELTDITFSKDYNFKIAEVVGYSNSFTEKNIIVNFGANNGIEKDFPVVSTNGIVGKVILVASNYSIILPYTNPNFKLSVKISRNNEQGILTANGVGDVFVDYLPLDSEVSLGDTIVTSNLSKIFPQGFSVGIVEKILTSKDKMHKVAKLKKINNPYAITEVIIISYKEENYDEKSDN